jgi:hypothetical protein
VDVVGGLGWLVAVELDGADTRRVGHLDHPVGMLVAEHAHRQDLGREAPDDVVDELGVHLAGRRGEHEPDRVGTEGGGEEGVLLGGDPADLHEHGRRHGSRGPCRSH